MSFCRGFASLLLTSLLLVAALILSLITARALFYQFKQLNNEHQARQDFWLAEGALQCAFSYLNANNAALPLNGTRYIDYCDVSVEKSSASDVLYTLHAKRGYTQITRQIERLTGNAAAPLLSESALYLKGNFTLLPRYSEEEAKCFSVLSQSRITYEASTINRLFTLDSSHSEAMLYSDWFAEGQFYCHADYLSAISGADSVTGQDLAGDLPSLAAFDYLLSGAETADYALIKAHIAADPLGLVLDRNNAQYSAQGWILNCSERLAKAWEDGKRRFWLEGHCALENNPFGSARQGYDSAIQIVCYGGVLYLSHVSVINGLVYFYQPPATHLFAVWQDLVTSAPEIGLTSSAFVHNYLINVQPNEAQTLLLMIQGQTTLNGAMAISSALPESSIVGDLFLAYHLSKATRFSQVLRWRKGSWRDF